MNDKTFDSIDALAEQVKKRRADDALEAAAHQVEHSRKNALFSAKMPAMWKAITDDVAAAVAHFNERMGTATLDCVTKGDTLTVSGFRQDHYSVRLVLSRPSRRLIFSNATKPRDDKEIEIVIGKDDLSLSEPHSSWTVESLARHSAESAIKNLLKD